ncbi:hypothetical protein NXW38_10105 [Bacteroides ovatus]|nr:hypothetical protein [Bacteroides ovatus]MCS3100328.1 hypothetical protein [Bacteroides ovatus]
MLEILGVDDFGLYSLVGGFVSMLSILTGTFSGTAARFITYEIGIGNPEILKRTISTIINLLIIIAIGVFIIGLVGGDIPNKYISQYTARANECGLLCFLLFFICILNDTSCSAVSSNHYSS